MIVADKEFKEDYESENSSEGSCGALDPQLYAMLKDLRKNLPRSTNCLRMSFSGCFIGADGYYVSCQYAGTSECPGCRCR